MWLASHPSEKQEARALPPPVFCGSPATDLWNLTVLRRRSVVSSFVRSRECWVSDPNTNKNPFPWCYFDARYSFVFVRVRTRFERVAPFFPFRRRF